MNIDSIHVEFNPPGAHGMIRLRMWIYDTPLSTSVFARDWIDVIEFLQVANVNNWIAIQLKGFTDEN
jgi:phenolic acid decarboxylase